MMPSLEKRKSFSGFLNMLCLKNEAKTLKRVYLMKMSSSSIKFLKMKARSTD